MSKYFRFEKNGKWGVKDEYGNIILEPIYDGIWLDWVDNGFIKVELNDKEGLFDTQGKLILKPVYDWIWLGWVDKELIQVELDEKWGLFNLKGKQLLPISYKRNVNMIELYQKKLKIKEDLLK